jgi:SAM-dependent methyltransferase
VGSLLGALLGGYILLFWLDLHHVYRVALSALVVGAAILTVLVFRIPRLLTALLVVLPALVGTWGMPAWDPERLTAGLFRRREPGPLAFQGADAVFEKYQSKVVFYMDDPTSTVSVSDGPPKGDGERLNRGIVTNGKPDGNLIGDYPTMALTALVPALLAESPERAFVIGYGTGVTAGELAALELTRVVHVAEISQGVIEAAPLFDEGNLNASKNPKVTIQRGDAYRTLLRSEGQYDLILSEPSNPWVTGVEMLYSVEFLDAARRRLAPGGVYAQWFHLYELDVETVELVLRTYASVFPHVSVWYTMASDLLLLGFDRPEHALDVGAIEERFRRPDFADRARRRAPYAAASDPEPSGRARFLSRPHRDASQVRDPRGGQGRLAELAATPLRGGSAPRAPAGTRAGGSGARDLPADAERQMCRPVRALEARLPGIGPAGRRSRRMAEQGPFDARGRKPRSDRRPLWRREDRRFPGRHSPGASPASIDEFPAALPSRRAVRPQSLESAVESLHRGTLHGRSAPGGGKGGSFRPPDWPGGKGTGRRGTRTTRPGLTRARSRPASE